MIATMVAAAIAAETGAASTQQSGNTAYAVTYIEAMPTAAQDVASLLVKHAAETRGKPGNLGYIPLQRDSPSRHFAVVEFWKDRQAFEDARGSEASEAFRDRLAAMLAVPLDERLHAPMAADLGRVQAALSGPVTQAVFVVTHVDVIPTKLEEGTAATKALFAPSSGEPGNLGFDVLRQSSRHNHMTLFEIWKDGEALEAHEISDAVRSYRRTLQPLSGSLYDQRVYRLLK